MNAEIERRGLRKLLALFLLFFALAAIDTWLQATSQIAAPNDAILSWVNVLRGKSGCLIIPMILITHLGSDPVLFLVVIGFAVLAARRRWEGDSLWFILTAMAARMAGTAAKLLWQSPRPDLIMPPPEINSFHGFGFPSGHALMSTVVYGLAAILVLRRAKKSAVRLSAVLICVALVVAVGLSRIYLGAHWPNDVLGGFLYGASILAASVFIRRVQENTMAGGSKRRQV